MGAILLLITWLLFAVYAVLILYYARAWKQAAREDGGWPMADGGKETGNEEQGMTNERVSSRQPSTVNHQPTDGGWQMADGGTSLQPSTFNLQPSTFLSVLIPARNEAANIRKCLDSLLQQDYPAHLFEIIVINDHSTDDTAVLVQQYKRNNLRLLNLADYLESPVQAYKKKALETGIAQSTGTLIITTDADCVVPPHWLRHIAAFYEEQQPAFIAMPVRYRSGNSPLAIFQSLDFMTLQGITAAAVHTGFHSMCNGANLAYTRAAFDAVEGFKDVDHIASGDDMLLMHKIANRFPGKIRYLLSREVIVETAPMPTLRDFMRQRIRWASKAGFYKDRRIFAVLLLVYLFNLMLLVLPVAAWVFNLQSSIFNIQYSILPCTLLLLIAKTAVELVFLFPVARFFGQQHLCWFFPPAQPFHIVYTVIAGWLGKFGTYQWKGREVK